MPKTAWIIICFPLLHGFVVTLNCTSPTSESLIEALEKELFTKKLYRPVKSFSDPLIISVDITVVGILGVNEKAQTLTMFIWQVLKWNIEGLSWDEKECGTPAISIPREKLWVPDIHITEFMEEDKSPKTAFVYLYNTGLVYDDKPVTVISSCKLGIYTFPFDVQNCSLTFGSYIHFAEDIRLIEGNTAANILEESLDVAQTKGEWELLDIQVAPASRVKEDGNFSDITHFIILRRRPILYVLNLIVPSVFLVTLDVFSFLLPPESVDRSAFKMTLIVGYTVFLLLMNELLPVTGNEVPLLNAFFSLSFALMVLSLLETLFIVNIQFRSSQHRAVPHWLSVLMLRYIAVVVCLPPVKKSNRVTVSLPENTKGVTVSTISSKDLQSLCGDSTPVKPSLDPTLDELRKLSRDIMAIRTLIDSHFQESKISQEWKMIGRVIDRLLFSLYFVFMTVTCITIVVIWHGSYP